MSIFRKKSNLFDNEKIEENFKKPLLFFIYCTVLA